MKRKIIQHGPSSLTVSIPSNWAKKNNLKKGNEIEVLEKNKDLVIKSSNKTQNKSIKISFENLNKPTRKDLIIALHQKGFQTINITNINEKIIKEIYSFLNYTQLSLEITKQDNNAIVIENISNPDQEQLDNLIKRTYMILIEYSYKILQILSTKENITENCFIHEKSINRISNYCKRIIVKENNEDSMFLFSIINNIVNISNQLSLILQLIDTKKINKKQLEGIKEKYEMIFEVLQESYNLYNKFSFKRYATIKKILENLDNNLQNESNFNINYIHIENINEFVKNLLKNILTLNLG